MTPVQIIFILVAAVTLGCALMVVTTHNLVRSALWLIAALFGVAIIFTLLEATFLAVVQVVIYIGAIAILMIFAIMLTRRVAMDSGPRYSANWGWAAVVAAVFFVALGFVYWSWPGLSTPLTDAGQPRVGDHSIGPGAGFSQCLCAAV